MNSLIHRDPFDDILRGFFVRPVEYSGAGGGEVPQVPQVRVDVEETPEGFALHAELPGIKKEDIHVQIDGPLVSISAERKTTKEQKEGERVLRSERYYGKVSRSFQLGQDIDEARASAKFTDGVLTLTLPKKVEAQATRLVVE